MEEEDLVAPSSTSLFLFDVDEDLSTSSSSSFLLFFPSRSSVVVLPLVDAFSLVDFDRLSGTRSSGTGEAGRFRSLLSFLVFFDVLTSLDGRMEEGAGSGGGGPFGEGGRATPVDLEAEEPLRLETDNWVKMLGWYYQR